MRVCHITTVHNPFDVRIFHKECKSLASAGHDVFLVAPHYRDEQVDHVQIKHIRRIKNPYIRILLAPLSAFFKALSTRSRICHLHDPELLPAGLALTIFGKKVIFDSHENVSGQIITKEWIPSVFIRSIISKLYRSVEIAFTYFYSGVIAVNEDINDKFSFKKRKVIIRNYPILSDFESKGVAEVDKNYHSILIYAGGLSRIRGIKELIQSMKKIDARLWLLGPWETRAYQKECEQLDAYSKCDYFGSLPFGKHYAYLLAADIGLINFYPERNHTDSLPNKIFEYMACGLPMVISDFEYWRKSFNENALFADPLNPEAIAEKVNLLLNDKDLLVRMGTRGKDLVLNNYSWEEESKKLLNFYNEL